MLSATVAVSACGGSSSNADSELAESPLDPVDIPNEVPGEVPGEIPAEEPGEEEPGETPAEEEPGEEEPGETPAEEEPGEEEPGETPTEEEPVEEEPDETPAEEEPVVEETGGTPIEAPEEEPLVGPPNEVTECTIIDVINVGTGTQRINIALEPGERLVLDDGPRGLLVGFDETSGELDYQPPAGRLPDFFEYSILAADDSVRVAGRMDIRLDPIRIMPLGDSITHGVEIGTGDLDLPQVPFRVGYRQSLLEQLSAASQVVDFKGQAGQSAGIDAGISDPDNGGYPGVDISFISNLVLGVFTEQPSDVVLLHIGTNQTPATAAGIEAILDEVDVWESTNFPVTVFVATLIPKREPTLQLQVESFNADLRTRIAARALVDDVILVEQADAVTVADINPADVGVHPTAPGYLRMADTWFEAMRATTLFPDCE